MRPQENHTPFVATGFGLTLAILAVFQVYFWREPGRIQAVEAADLRRAQTAGSELYAENCAACHGEGGEGNLGPVLNSRTLLKTTADDTLFSLIRTGVPGTVMPAWGQTYGGPFTDQQAVQLVAFIRAWEATAPEIAPVVIEPDPVRGATIFAETCFICHGENGQGTDRAPMLNDPATLRDFDNAWYRKTIANGRPAKGMPTWGTVLSPQQIDDLVALISAWREGQAVMPLISMRRHLRSALFAVQQFDQPDAS
nr:c-type cytochrome [Chloroflexota bacterium]